MTRSNPGDMAASVRARLQNLAKQRSEDFQLVLSRYAIERLVYRLSRSEHTDRFVVKGAILFHVWTENPYRATRDIDFLAHGDNAIENLMAVFADVCDTCVEDDGLIFQANTITGQLIKPDQEYEGVRIQLTAFLQRARIPVQIDIGFGDAISPAPTQLPFPSMLGFPTSTIAAYPRETVVAEKLQAMVYLGIANSRMKDFFDLWVLSQHFEFRGNELAEAIRSTFSRRRTPIPNGVPFALTEAFFTDESKQRQWKAFLRNVSVVPFPSIDEVFGQIKTFLMPMIAAANGEESEANVWLPKGPWQF